MTYNGNIERVARAIFDADLPAEGIIWEKYKESLYIPQAIAAIKAFLQGNPMIKLTDKEYEALSRKCWEAKSKFLSQP